jgi:hypothetical protein
MESNFSMPDLSERCQFTMHHRVNLLLPPPGRVITGCMTINHDHIQCARQISFASWSKPWPQCIPAQQPNMHQREIGDRLQTPIEVLKQSAVARFVGLLDTPLQTIKRLNSKSFEFLSEASGRKRALSLEFDHCSLSRTTTAQIPIEQGNSIKNCILKLYRNGPCVSMRARSTIGILWT